MEREFFDLESGEWNPDAQIRYKSILVQLEDLIALAEASAKAIDLLHENLSKLRARSFYVVSSLYIISIISGFAFLYVVDSMKGVYSIAWQVALALTVVIVSLFFVRLIFELRSSRYRIQRELSVERHAQQELISIIDGQLRRLSVDEEYFPISNAILHIRVRRLERHINGKD